MKKIKIRLIVMEILFIFVMLMGVTIITYATFQKDIEINKKLILNDYKMEKIDFNKSIETVISISEKNIPKINDVSIELLKTFEQEVTNVNDVQKVYDKILDREVTRIITNSAEIDIDSKGNLVSYENLEDFSTIDKDRKEYSENEVLLDVEYEFDDKKDLENIISLVEEKNNLVEYKLIDCSNNIDGCWILTWCKDYGNELINPYECVNIAIDAKDGTIMLFERNEMVPTNQSVLEIAKDEALECATEIISEFDYKKTEIELNFFRPNFFWEDGGPYEMADFVRLAWKIVLDDSIIIQVDTETGEVLGGSYNKSIDAGRAMGVVDFYNQKECTTLAYNALNRLGYNQTNYEPVYWEITQTDIDWMLHLPDVYGLYLSCHGLNHGNVNEITDFKNWSVYSNVSFGNWHFVYLDACQTSANLNFANAFGAIGSGKCFVGWNVDVYQSTAYDFNRRFLPRLGTMSVYQAVVTSLVESRNAGYNVVNGNMCDPGFAGDSNYYGWAW